MMSDSEDDFVEVNGYTSSDSDWEKIDSYSSGEESVSTLQGQQSLPQQLVQSYYRSPDNTHAKHLIDNNAPQIISEYPPLSSSSSEDNKPRKRDSKKSKNLKEARRKQWTKLTLRRGNGAPYDPVEFLGITSEEKALLSHLGILTIGQLAYINVSDYSSSVESENFSAFLDLQERAYTTVSTYAEKTSSLPAIVWGYVYLSSAEISDILRNGYIDSDALQFVWSPMPALMYRDQVAVDNIVAKETKNRSIRGRYARFVKINLSKLCNEYYGRLYQKDPQNIRAQDKWHPVSLMEACDLAQREELWYPFEPGHNIFSLVCHGSVVVPTGKIPKDCVELDKDECKFNHSDDDTEQHSDTEGHSRRPNSILDILDYF